MHCDIIVDLYADNMVMLNVIMWSPSGRVFSVE